MDKYFLLGFEYVYNIIGAFDCIYTNSILKNNLIMAIYV